MPLVQIASPDVRTHSTTPGRASSLPCLCICRDIFIYTCSPKDIFTQYLHLTTQFKCDRNRGTFSITADFSCFLWLPQSLQVLVDFSLGPISPKPRNKPALFLQASSTWIAFYPMCFPQSRRFHPFCCLSATPQSQPSQLSLKLSQSPSPGHPSPVDAPLPWMPLSPGRPPLLWTPLSPGCSSQVHPARPRQPHAATPSLEPCPARPPLETVTTHSKFKPTSSFTPGAAAPRDSSFARVPSVFLFSHCCPVFPQQGLCPLQERGSGRLSLCRQSGWAGMSHFLVTEPAGRWVPRTGQPYFCSFSNTPLFLPPFTWLNWVNSSRKIFWKHFFFKCWGKGLGEWYKLLIIIHKYISPWNSTPPGHSLTLVASSLRISDLLTSAP